MTINILDIVPGTSVDGPGLRTAVYMAGCSHRCPGCHNPDSWDCSAGRAMTIDEIVRIAAENGFPVTLTGGDPLHNPDAVIAIADALKPLDLGDIWLYTGFTWEQIAAGKKLMDAVVKVDVVVDGPFIEAKRDLSLRFRGSANQRIILVGPSLGQGRIVEWQPPTFDF